MPSPFPGMDPYLEGYLWPDVYRRLATQICRQLARASIRAQTRAWELWPIRLRDCLPTVPIPLRAPDPDVPLDLLAVLRASYEEAACELSIDYSLSPSPPPLSAEETEWLKVPKAAREQKPEAKGTNKDNPHALWPCSPQRRG